MGRRRPRRPTSSSRLSEQRIDAGKALGQGSASLEHRLVDDSANLTGRFLCRLLINHPIGTQLLFCLRHTEVAGRKLATLHSIKQVLAVLEPFMLRELCEGHIVHAPVVSIHEAIELEHAVLLRGALERPHPICEVLAQHYALEDTGVVPEASGNDLVDTDEIGDRPTSGLFRSANAVTRKHAVRVNMKLPSSS